MFYGINDPMVKEFAKEYDLSIEQAHKGLNEYADFIHKNRREEVSMKVIAEGDMEFCIRGFNNVMDCTGCEGCGEIEAITREEFEKRQRFMFGNDSHLPPIILE